MAKYRQLYTEFWLDGFVVELTPEEKYFYLYLLTNYKTSQCGIYELPIRTIVNDTGYNHETIKKLLKRFEDYKKILYCDETKEIMIVNWVKYNPPNNINSIKCVNKELNNVKNKNFIQMFYVQCKKNDFDCEKIFQGLHRGYEGACQGHASNEVINNKQEIINNKQKVINNEEAIVDNKQELLNKEEDLVNNSQGIKRSKEQAVHNDFVIDDCDFKRVIKVFNNNIHPITPIEYEKLQYWANDVSCSVIIMAIEEAVNHDARTMKYIDKILFCWVGKGIKTPEGVAAYLREWEKKKRSTAENGQAKSRFCDYEQRNYDFKELEHALLGLDKET